jgi:hypothetical protein
MASDELLADTGTNGRPLADALHEIAAALDRLYAIAPALDRIADAINNQTMVADCIHREQGRG